MAKNVAELRAMIDNAVFTNTFNHLFGNSINMNEGIQTKSKITKASRKRRVRTKMAKQSRRRNRR